MTSCGNRYHSVVLQLHSLAAKDGWMYRWLLCWRYLRTRYIALASVVSVTLGVATLIIVNSVMAGFTTEMKDRMHGILSDVIVECHSSDGLTNYKAIQQRIRQVVGEDLVGMTTVVHVPAMINITHRNETITRQINLIGIDIESYADVSDFSKYLMHPENREKISFALRESGYAPDRIGFPESGWVHRRRIADARKRMLQLQAQWDEETRRNQYLKEQIDSVMVPSSLPQSEPEQAGGQVDGGGPHTNGSLAAAPEGLSLPDLPQGLAGLPASPDEELSNRPAATWSVQGPAFDAIATRPEDQAHEFDDATEQHDGIVLGISIGTTRFRNEFGDVTDYYYVQPGDDVRVTFPSAGTEPRACSEKFTVVDFYESKMSEYDATFAFVPMERLQKSRGMQDAVNSIQLKLRDGADLDAVRDSLSAQFPMEMMVQVNTWRDLQGALLAAVQMETTILNILLFLIIAVAGFGILATFFMIVVEKTKDIGILKSLGASGTGVASIFLGYGLLLGAFGSGVGAIAGLIFVANINSVADLLESITGQEVFDPTVYYFETIPTIVNPATVVMVVIGAMLIAVMASFLPSIRAARMHPVEALRYE
jgi:lipoprotein-releasing system permease protein